MPVYEYTALNPKGKNISGVLDAESTQAVRQKLRTSQIFPVTIKEIFDADTRKAGGWFSFNYPFTRIRLRDISMMTRQLATLLGAGFPLVSALDSLIPQTRSQSFKKLLSHIKDSIVEGNSFAGTISQYPATFSPIYVSMVHAGETSGTLEIVLERLADITEKQQALYVRIQTTLIYPALMTLVGMFVLILLLTFVVPNITAVFADMDQVLPAPTLVLIAVSKFLKSYGWTILVGIILGLFIFRRIIKTSAGLRFYDKIQLVLPGFGQLIKKLAVTRFARTLGSLLENGIPMLPALEIVKNIVGNVLIGEAVENAARDVGKGQALHTSLAATNIFPHLSIQMIQVGENSGALETMLNKIADVYEKEVETTVMSLTALLEPLLIILMGIVIGFIVLSICLPIFEMNQLVL